METFEGTYKRTIYSSPQTGPSIVVYEGKDGDLTITGKMLPIAKKIKYRFSGTYINHPKYGKQLKAETYEEIVETTQQIVLYLSSGLIAGIGEKMAQRIVATFKEDTLKILDEDIDRLLEVKGISKKKIDKIRDSYILNRAARDVVVTLARYGISAYLATDVYAMFGSKSMDIIKNRPYLLSMIQGISFITADAIAEKTYEYCTDYERFCTCARYVLLRAEVNSSDLQAVIGSRTTGSTGMLKNDFGNCMLALLRGEGVDKKFICEKTIEMIKDKLLFYKKMSEGEVFFLPGVYNIEKSIAENLQRLCYSSVKRLDKIEEKIYKAEEALGITLSLSQLNAVKMVFRYGLSIITGPPGSGKSTTFKVIAWIYENYEKGKIMFLAPTGRAAARIKELGYDASTIHSGLQIGGEQINQPQAEETVFTGPMLIGVDECSMIDARLAYRLLSSIGKGCRVVLCGDPDQLPSVGAGAVLRDLLSVESIPCTKLETVYRTSSSGNIFLNCNKIRLGDADLYEGNGFDFVEAEDIRDVEDALIAKYLEKKEKYGIENVMLLSPYKEHEAGVNSLNRRIQAIVNPKDTKGKIFLYHNDEYYYKIGDPVLNLVNEKELGISNGDVGYVVEMGKNKEGDEELVVKFADKLIGFSRDQLKNITLGYACTVHKAQGAEYKAVIFPAHENFSLLYKRNLIYTAISRGKNEVTIVGKREALKKGILAEDKSKRITALKPLLKSYFGEFVDVSFTA